MSHTETIKNAGNEQTPSRTRGLLPSRRRNENLDVPDGKRILCTAMRIDQHQMFLGAFGPEQTKIVYTFVDILRDYPRLNIRSVCTTRSEGAAGSYIMLGDLHGDADAVVEFGRNIQENPWLEPAGTKVNPEAIIDLKIIAPAGLRLLHDALTIISNEYGANIESMIHRTFHNMFDHGFDLLRQVSRGNDLGFIAESIQRDESRGQRGGERGDGDRQGGTRGTEGLGGRDGLGTDGLGAGGADTGTPDAGRTSVGGTGGGKPGIGGPGAGGVIGGNDTDFVAVTKMRIELPSGTDLDGLKRDLELVGKDWEFHWEQRRGNGRFDPKFTRKLFGGLN